VVLINTELNKNSRSGDFFMEMRKEEIPEIVIKKRHLRGTLLINHTQNSNFPAQRRT